MSFMEALIKLKNGARVQRGAWDMKMYCVLTRTATFTREHEKYELQPFLVLRTANGWFVPWQPGQSDMYATDWREAAHG